MKQAIKSFLTEPQHNRRSIRWLIATLALVSLALVGAVIAVLIMASKGVEHRYFLFNHQGQLIEVEGEATPAFDDAKRAGWLLDQLREAMTFSFSNWRYELPRAQEGFDEMAWKKLHDAMIKGGWWSKVTSEQTNLTTLPVNVPVVDTEEIVNGVRTWKYTVELLHEWEGNGVRRSQRTRASVTLKARPLSIAPAGVLITDIDLFGVIN